MTIKRYDIHDDGVYVSMEPRETGRFVKHDDHLAALRREREPVEPVAWRVRVRSGGDGECQPLYTTPPDALALVAAAYRDAADKVEDHFPGTLYASNRTKCLDAMAPPADAQAALTAIERAAYERGVRDAADVADDLDPDIWHYSTGNRARYGQSTTAKAILALLTQEGR